MIERIKHKTKQQHLLNLIVSVVLNLEQFILSHFIGKNRRCTNLLN